MAIIDVTHLLCGPDKQDQLRAIEHLIATGAEYVSYGGDQVKARLLNDLLRIRDMLRGDLGLPTGGRRNRVRCAVFIRERG